MKIVANGISINYELAGSGPWFTLIHGASENLNSWYNQVPAFARRHKVLTYDVRGHGQTECPDADISPKVWVQDLRGLLAGLGVSETVLLGYSMGGRIAVEFTRAHPQMVKALIISNSFVGTPATLPSEEEIKQMEAQRRELLEGLRSRGMAAMADAWLPQMYSPGFAQKNPAAYERNRAIVLQNDPKNFLRVMESMFNPTPPPDTTQLRCPTLIIVGEHDPYAGAEAGRIMQQAIPGAQLKVFPTGHPAAVEMPEEYNATVLEFLAGVGKG